MFYPDHLEGSSRMFPAVAELKPAREKFRAVEKKRRGAGRTSSQDHLSSFFFLNTSRKLFSLKTVGEMGLCYFKENACG